MNAFDDSRLEDAAIGVANERLRFLAQAGSRLRRLMLLAREQTAELSPEPLPRAIVALGSEARLLRAALEPTCPVPFVAWPQLGLPAWVNTFDLVITMGATNPVALTAVREAARRQCRILVAGASGSELVRNADSRLTTRLPSDSPDTLATAIVMLDALRRIGIDPVIDPEGIADSMDLAASECSPLLDISQNPAKMIALELAETAPLVWGGSILAARASRRIADALRVGSGQMVLAADADALLPLLQEARPRDLFADPFEQSSEHQPALVLLDDGLGDDLALRQASSLTAAANQGRVRVSKLHCETGDRMTRYATLLQQGLFAATYLGIGLGR